MNGSKMDYQKAYRRAYAKSHRRISISVTNAEYSAFEHLAHRDNTKVTSLVRDFAFAGLTDTLTVPADLKTELQELSFLIRNIANNVNQAAHHSNTIRHLADEQGLLLEIKKLEDTIKNFVQERMKS